jgi:hypothetical protein
MGLINKKEIKMRALIIMWFVLILIVLFLINGCSYKKPSCKCNPPNIYEFVCDYYPKMMLDYYGIDCEGWK